MYKQYNFKADAMAQDADFIKDKIKHHHKNIIILWCLCKCFEEYGDINGLQHHEKIKLRGEIFDIAKIKAKNKDEVNIKRQAIEKLWYDGEDYGTNYMSVISILLKKFDKENIMDAKIRTFVAEEFCKESKKIANLICRGTYTQIVSYINSAFTKSKDV